MTGREAPLKSESPAATGQFAGESSEQAPIIDREKTFRKLQAEYALAGHELRRTHPADGPTSFYVTRWGMTRHLATLDAASQWLRQIGGAP